MKISINRNTVWCDLFVEKLVGHGIKYACISPGSRSTPLTLALASNKQIESFPIVDERSSVFFALGLAKKSNSPVVVVTTSGTAVAELYAAIIEAYYQRIPLIICTADRPSNLRNSGANQTINQKNIYANHIRYFVDAGLPDINKFKKIISIANSAVNVSLFKNRGPVHINFPFEKPFEPKSYTDKIELETINKLFSESAFEINRKKFSKLNFQKLAQKFKNADKGLILVGVDTFKADFAKSVNKFAKILGWPIYFDGSTSLRNGNHSKENLVENLTSFVRAANFQKQFDPEIIIQFGSAPTSNILLEFFKKSKADKFIVNEFGDRRDPSLTAKNILCFEPAEFCDSVINYTDNFKRGKSDWLGHFKKMNALSQKFKVEIVERAAFPFEGRIISEIINGLPENSNLMISNSLPIRDTDFFAPAAQKKINIFTNRGASGIDGINSTALGISKASDKPTYLLIGDLAFYHDMNGLLNSLKFGAKLTVILVDNSGGGIFQSLPIAEYKEFLKENFVTPLNLNFEPFIKGYKGNFTVIKSWSEFKRKLLSSVGNKRLNVLSIKTDAVKSKLIRKKYWDMAAQETEKYINEIRNRRN